MKKTILIGATIFFSTSALAEVRFLDDIMAQATAEDIENLSKLLMQAQTVTVKDIKTGRSMQKVISVEPGSMFERAGVKKGDFLINGKFSKK